MLRIITKASFCKTMMYIAREEYMSYVLKITIVTFLYMNQEPSILANLKSYRNMAKSVILKLY